MNSAADHGSKKLQWLRWGGTAISILLFVWLIARQNWHEVWRYLQQIPFWLLPVALLCYLTGMLANAVRWYILLQAPKIRVSFWTTVKIVFTGAYVSNFLPSTIGGDTVRFIGLMHLTSNRAVGLASVILDRLINLSAFITVLPLSVLTFGAPATWLELSLQAGAPLPIVLMAGAKPGPVAALLSRVKRWFQRGREAFEVWLKRPRFLILAFCVSWLSIFVVFIAIWLVARGLGIPVALYQVMGITGITYLLTLLPISVNGYGLREVAITTLYLPLGASLEQAATLALITRFLSMLETLPGALWLSQVVSGQVGQLQTNQKQADQVQSEPEEEAKVLRRDWITLGAVTVYISYVSYAVVRLLGTDLTPRVRFVLEVGWVITLAAALLVVGLIVTKKGEWLYQLQERFTRTVQTWSPWARGLVYVALLATSALLTYTNISRGLMDNDCLRYALLFAFLVFAFQFWPFQAPERPAGRILVTLLAFAYALQAGDYLKFVVDYPFSLSWSEGNRFYDYSLIFGKSLYWYDGNLTIPYYSPGRYALWGLWFLIPGLPIAFHRFWNAILWIVPPLLLGWLQGRGVSRQPGVRLGLALWIGLFLSQGPIYAPILLAASLLIALDRASLWQRGLSIAAASLYTGLSRWTWFGAPGAWSGLLELSSHEPSPQRPLIRRLGAVALVAFAGSLPGILANWTRFAVPKQSTLSLSQPLLWYRLFPNATLKTGILPGLGLAAGPLLLILAWLVISRRWKLDWLQLVAIGGVLGVTLVAGVVASVKIGGGSNLHNLDMFLITLAFLVMLYLDQASEAQEPEGRPTQRSGGLDLGAWPIFAKGALVAASLLLVWPYFSNVRRLVLPPQGDVQRSLQNLRQLVERYKSQGEILFLDQRQLLTFGVVEGVPLIPEYEKKYLMDQAMAGNVAYFQSFYEDLVNKRFVLIVSEPLFKSYDDAYDPFSEENNAWVKWVSEAVLCFYTPEKTYKEVRVQLLVPRAGSLDCELPLK